ncbi:hypothetical protein [Terrihabitans sp. B22-R8]|uniref:hypothetical protein n=1 Tax=Terrihabitans sp. B22-R8 TaxID=3425128 RepID=UPI00403C2065
MSFYGLGAVLGAVLLMSAGAAVAPPLRAPLQCGNSEDFVARLCTGASYSDVLARTLAQRVRSAAYDGQDAVLDALFSSPVPGVDISPGQRLARWWMEQTGQAVMSRYSYQLPHVKNAAEAALLERPEI